VLSALATLLAVAEAAEEEEPSKTAFYVAGITLTVFALVIAAIGIRGHEHFPPSKGAARAVMGLAVLLVAATMASAVLTG
jgi:drug/metabolite transporter (DMT)-like permease